jgi:hypothetical protein
MSEMNVEKESPSPCCGGPAKNEADACCVQDAEAKAAGDRGCGCGTPTAAAKDAAPASSCCS